nr:hypothetical protein [Tanacetum cinerariifolium]
MFYMWVLHQSKVVYEDFSESNEEFSSIDEDSFSIDDIDYVEASPPDSELVSSEDISPTKEQQVLNTLPTHPTLQLNMKFQPSSEYLFAYVVWIFLPFLVYSVVPYYLLSIRNEDIIFDLGICKSTFFRPDISHRCGTVKKFNTYHGHLNKCPMLIHGQNNPPLEFSLTDDDSFSFDKIDYVEASPPDSELVRSEVMEIVTPELGGIKASNDDPILIYDPIISGTPPNLTPSRESNFFLEVDAFLAVEDEPTSSQFLKSYLDSEGGMLLFEAFLSDDHSSDFKTKKLYDNSSSRPPEELVSANFDAASESFSPSHILVKDSESLMEEIDLFCTPDFSRPPAKPPDGDTGILNIKMMDDIYDQKAFMHKLMITLAPHQEKSPDLLSHRCGTVKKFNTHRSHLNKCPMKIHGQNNPPLDVLLFHFYPLDSLKYGGNWSSSVT